MHGWLRVEERKLDDDVLVTFYESHPAAAVSVGPTDRVELHVDLEIGTGLTDERALQPGREATLRREDREEVFSRHARLNCLHAFQRLGHPRHVVRGGRCLAESGRCVNSIRTD